LFVSASEDRWVPEILSELESDSVLTVGDREGFADRGGMINFRLSENRIRLDINVEATRRAGLRVSSQLLKLARIVPAGGTVR
ncbi:MAG: YfiR family protein, partial [Candidatus Binatia bacterium]